MNIKRVGVSIFLSLLCAFASAQAQTSITSCTTITTPGPYILTGNIVNTNSFDCIVIATSGVDLNCQGYTIRDVTGTGGAGVLVQSGLTATTVRNCGITGFTNGGIGILSTGSGGSITNNTTTGNSEGIALWWGASGNNVTNNNTSSNAVFGIDIFDGSNNNTVLGNTSDQNGADGIALEGSTGNQVTGNWIRTNTTGGIFVSASGNTIYNNFFSNAANVDPASSGTNTWWKTSNTIGSRISGGGTIGGNYWSNASWGGYSDNCADANFNGFCDVQYPVPATGDLDLFALSPRVIASTCGTVINSGGTYRVPSNVTGFPGNLECIRINAPNVTLDCLGSSIVGTSYPESHGIINVANNVTTRNCRISNFSYGIAYWNNTGGLIDNNAVTSAAQVGIYLNNASSTTVQRNTLQNGHDGMQIYNSSNTNTVTNNDISGFANGILVGYYSSGNNIFFNEMRGNDAGMAISSGGNTIYNNYFNTNNMHVWFAGVTPALNTWYVGKTNGTRKFSPGDRYSGNFWTGFSDGAPCVDSNQDGFCENAYPVDAVGVNFDNEPHSDDYVGPSNTITALPYTITSPGTYTLAANLTATGTAITVGAPDVVVDCGGYAIAGNGTGYGVYNSSYDNVAVRNCNISGFNVGVFYDNPGYNGADYGEISGNTLTENTDGIKLYWSGYNNIFGNTASGNSGGGIVLTWFSGQNTLTGNVANQNGAGLYIQDSGNNVMSGNNWSSNGFGTYLYSAYSGNNSYTNDICDLNSDTGIRIDWAGGVTFTGGSASNNGQWDFNAYESYPNTATNLTVGQNTLSFTAQSVQLKGNVSLPADPAGYRSIGKSVEAVSNSEGGFLNLSIAYDDTDLPARTSESTLRIWKNSGGTWTNTGFFTVSTVDTVDNIVYAEVNDFGSFFAPLAQITSCSDGTLVDQCSIARPRFCNAGELVDRCTTCGCPSSKPVCNTTTDQCEVRPKRIKEEYTPAAITGVPGTQTRLRVPRAAAGMGLSSDSLVAAPVAEVTPPVPAKAAVVGSPNPFNPRTTLHYAVPRDGYTRLQVYDIAGRMVASLVDGELAAGEFQATWDGRDHAGNPLASGLYLVRLDTSKESAVTKVVLMR